MTRLVVHLLLVAGAASTPASATATFNLTGDWIITCGRCPFEDETQPVAPTHIAQNGTYLSFWGREGSIDSETGSFVLPLVITHCAAPFGVHAKASDNDHFSGTLAGFWDPLNSPCHVAGGWPIFGERIGSPPTPTPTATVPQPTSTPLRPFCSGDCDGNGRATVDEIIRLVRCSIGICIQPGIAVPDVVTACADANQSGTIEITELVAAVNNVLHGCPR